MKVALVHDYIKEYGGAERVLETLHEMWPKAPVYTSVYLPKFLGPHRKRFEKWDIRTSFLQKIPMKGKLLSFFRFFGPLIFKSINLSEYDLVIVSAAGTYTSPNFVTTGKDTVLICYYHTPPRYLYGYATAAPWKKIWWRRLLYFWGQIPMHFLRLADFEAAQKPNYVVANSKEVAGRIKKFYRRKAMVIYPPVDEPKLKGKIEKKNYYLAGGRLARPKRVDLAIRAASKLSLSLKVFGKDFQNYIKELKSIAGPTVKFVGEVDDRERNKLMAEAKAYIFPAELEDFGITPVEAMYVGTPVIACYSGGVKESVVDKKTGIFFKKPTTASLIEAIKKFEKTNIKKEDCIKQAKKFSKKEFKKKFLKLVKNSV